jgi:hypothetical protein
MSKGQEIRLPASMMDRASYFTRSFMGRYVA